MQKQEMTVRWGACTSDLFKVTNGVRHGGILSPQLFNKYIDGLSDILNKSSIGGPSTLIYSCNYMYTL